MIEALNAMTKSVELAASALDVMADLVKQKNAEIERLRAALEYIAEGGLAYPEKHARAVLEGK